MGTLFSKASRLHQGPAGADDVRARRPQLIYACAEVARGICSHHGPAAADGEGASRLARPGMCRGIWRTKDQMMPMVCEISDCSSQGMCRGWSRHLGTPRRGWCRWCARQHAAAAQGMCRGWSRHLRGIWYQLLPMVCEPASRPGQGGAEACRGIRADHGPVSADGVRDRCP